jgi:hypothetical protein
MMIVLLRSEEITLEEVYLAGHMIVPGETLQGKKTLSPWFFLTTPQPPLILHIS